MEWSHPGPNKEGAWEPHYQISEVRRAWVVCVSHDPTQYMDGTRTQREGEGACMRTFIHVKYEGESCVHVYVLV